MPYPATILKHETKCQYCGKPIRKGEVAYCIDWLRFQSQYICQTCHQQKEEEEEIVGLTQNEALVIWLLLSRLTEKNALQRYLTRQKDRQTALSVMDKLNKSTNT